MHIQTSRDYLLPAVTLIGGVVERKQTLPILGNVLIKASNKTMELTATDLEVEVTTEAALTTSDEEGAFTLPARKFIDICRTLPDGSQIDIRLEGEKAVIKSERSRFTLGVLPAKDFPNMEISVPEKRFDLPEAVLKTLFDRTGFAMAQQDVRYYLNGLMIELGPDRIRTVATDGHRLALSEMALAFEQHTETRQLLLPRKAIMELGRLLSYTDNNIAMEVSSNIVRFRMGTTRFTAKLIDGRFPDYARVIPRSPDKKALVDRDMFRQALTRASILSSEKYKGIRLTFEDNLLLLQAHNPEQEEAEERLPVAYQDEKINIGFNVGYLLDVLGAIDSAQIAIELTDSNSSALISAPGDACNQYVVMPMRL